VYRVSVSVCVCLSQTQRQRLLLIDWRLSRTKQPLWCTHCDVPSQRSATTPRDKSAAVRALPVFLNQTCWFLPHGNAGCAEGTAAIQSFKAWSHDSAGSLVLGSQWHQPNCRGKCVDIYRPYSASSQGPQMRCVGIGKVMTGRQEMSCFSSERQA